MNTLKKSINFISTYNKLNKLTYNFSNKNTLFFNTLTYKSFNTTNNNNQTNTQQENTNTNTFYNDFQSSFNKNNYAREIKQSLLKDFNINLSKVQKLNMTELNSLIELVPLSKSQNKIIPKSLYNKAIEDFSSKEDVDHMLKLISLYYTNKLNLTANDFDNLLYKAIKVDCIHLFNEIFNCHRSLLYYPNIELISKINSYYVSSIENKSEIVSYKDYINFYKAISRKYYIPKSSEMFNNLIKIVNDNDDNKLITELFLDILDYKDILFTAESLNVICYANSLLLKDEVFYALLKESISNSVIHKVEIPSSVWFACLMFEMNDSENKTRKEACEDIVNKINECKNDNNLLVKSNESIKEFLDKTNSEEEGSDLAKEEKEFRKEILEKINKDFYMNKDVFDESYLA